MYNAFLILVVQVGLLSGTGLGIDGNPGPSLIQTGTNTETQFPRAYLDFQTEDYIPVCGKAVASPYEYPDNFLYIDKQCEQAFQAFLANSDSFATYDTNGSLIAIATAFGGSSNQGVCYCLTLQNPGPPNDFNACFLIGSDARMRLRAHDGGAIVIANTTSSSEKALPLCDAVSTFDENAAAPPEAAPSTASYGPITVTVADTPVTMAYSGEVLPIQTAADHKRAPEAVRNSVLSELAKDPDTRAFGQLLEQIPSIFDSLKDSQEYYFFAPTTEFVVQFLKDSQNGLRGLSRREGKVFVPPDVQQQIAEKVKNPPDLKRVASTLLTTLYGETKYVDLGPYEGARVVSKPANGAEGTVSIISGLGNATTIHPEDIPFEYGVIKKCDGFFTRPRALEIVLALTNGKSFSTALEKANLLQDLSDKPKVTIFAAEESALEENKLPEKGELQRLIYDGLAYSPDMSDGKCLPTRDGSTVRISRNGKDILVNGVRIVKPDVIAKNGVVHYLEKIPPKEICMVTPPDEGEDAASTAVLVAASKATVVAISAVGLLWHLLV